MRLDLPEFDNLPADRRQAILEEAARRVNNTHGQMGNTPHYVGCALAATIAVSRYIAGRGPLLAVLLSTPAYAAALAVGVLLWRRSMLAETRRVIRQLASNSVEDQR